MHIIILARAKKNVVKGQSSGALAEQLAEDYVNAKFAVNSPEDFEVEFRRGVSRAEAEIRLAIAEFHSGNNSQG